MFLSRFDISNYLSHRSTTLQLSPLTVLVGPCNAGKSAVFDALINFAMVARGRVRTAFSPGPFSFIGTRNRGAGAGAQIAFSASIKSPDVELEYDLSYRRKGPEDQSDDAAYEILSERLKEVGKGDLFNRSPMKIDTSLRAAKALIDTDQGILAAIRSPRCDRSAMPSHVVDAATQVSRIIKYRLQPFFLRQAVPIPDEAAPKLEPRGDGLAGILYHLEQHAPDKLRLLEERLRPVVGGFDSFEFNATRGQEIGFSIKFKDDRRVVSAARLSDGTLHFLGLCVLLFSDSRPQVVCLEEPEIGLNSSAMRALGNLIKEASGSTQLLVSTHSPYLLMTLWNDCVKNPFEQVHYVTIAPSGDERGQSKVVPMGEYVKRPDLRRSIDIKAASEILDGKL